MINEYKFGEIIIDHIPYLSDVIVLPDRVQEDWWRKEGHKLQLVDIQDVLEENSPTSLVVGTGKFGIMQISDEVKQYLEQRNITLYAERTEKAVEIFNHLLVIETKIVGAFHITC